MLRELDACLDLFLGWLAQERGLHAAVKATEQPGPATLVASAIGDSSRLAIEVHPLLHPSEDETWLAERERLERELAADLPGANALWVPPGADLLSEAEKRAAFVRRVRETAEGLAEGERSAVDLPIAIYLRKTSDEGGLVSVSGGLNAHWARLTEGVRGTFELDSRQLHRLPESDDHLQQLTEAIWETARQIEGTGEWVEIDTIDSWTIHRLSQGEGFAVIGRPPGELVDVGLAVRRNFRRILAEAAPRLRDREADTRALVVVGPYGRMDQEGASTAMRGYDPTLYSGLDYVCLATDGRVKALLESPVRPAPNA